MPEKTILVVDDEAHILHVVSLKLGNAGFHILTANDAEEATELAAANAVDLVITDYHMPGPNGLELARRLHAQAGRRDLPIILLTAHGLALEPVEISRSGIACCLSKPFSPREVLTRVQELLLPAPVAASAPAR